VTIPASTKADAPQQADRRGKHVVEVIVRMLYAITLLPVVMWCLFVTWAIAKNRYEARMTGGSESLWPMMPTYLLALVIPLLWTAGVAGSAILARRGRRWLLWATVLLVPVLIALVAVITPSVIYVVNYTANHEKMSGPVEP
jgi:hypothetical protein